jgi:hypothetical protein
VYSRNKRLPPTVKMKSQHINAYSRLDDELYVSDELEELLYAKWLLKVKKEEDQKEQQRQARWNLFFSGSLCHLHDRYGCRECRVYGLGLCPSAKEEGYHMTSSSWADQYSD